METPLVGSWSFRCSLRDWESLASNLLFVFDKPLPHGSVDGEYERHGEYSAWLIRQGSAHLVAEGLTIDAVAGDWVVCFANKIRQTMSDDAHLLSVRIACNWPDGQRLFAGRPVLKFKASKYPHLESLALQLGRDTGGAPWLPEDPSFTYLWRTRMDFVSYTRHRRRLMEWQEGLAEILQDEGLELAIPSGIDPRLAAALHEIDRSAINAPFPGDNMTRTGGLTIGQLNRMCLRAYGQTLYGYWEARRLERAKAMLGQTGVSVKEIAYQLGFRQLSHFSAWFKRHEGASPRQFQAMV